MKPSQFYQAVARATGESVALIRTRGFGLLPNSRTRAGRPKVRRCRQTREGAGDEQPFNRAAG